MWIHFIWQIFFKVYLLLCIFHVSLESEYAPTAPLKHRSVNGLKNEFSARGHFVAFSVSLMLRSQRRTANISFKWRSAVWHALHWFTLASCIERHGLLTHRVRTKKCTLPKSYQIRLTGNVLYLVLNIVYSSWKHSASAAWIFLEVSHHLIRIWSVGLTCKTVQ